MQPQCWPYMQLAVSFFLITKKENTQFTSNHGMNVIGVNLEKPSRLRREQDNVGEIIVCCVLCLLHCLGSTKALLVFLVGFFRKNKMLSDVCFARGYMNQITVTLLMSRPPQPLQNQPENQREITTFHQEISLKSNALHLGIYELKGK